MSSRFASPVLAGRRSARSASVWTAAAACLILLGGCASTNQQDKNRPEVVSGLVNLGPADHYPAGTGSTDYLQRYGIVLVNESGPVVAIRPQCSDGGCLARWDPDHRKFVCPCDGSEFDLLGRPIKGPAKQPLPAVATQRNSDGTLSVDLSRLYALPGAHLPSRAD